MTNVDETNAPTNANRVVWIDALKGAAISLVVFGHVLGGSIARHWMPLESAWQKVYEFIYLIHMPVFFMISGLLLYHSARAKPVDAVLSRVGSIVWPYLLWDVLIRWLLLPIIGRFMSSMPTKTGLVELLFQALTGHLGWFLWTLFVVQTIYIVLARIPAIYLLVVSVAIYLFFPDTHSVPLHAIITFMPFLLLGAVVRPHLNQLNQLCSRRDLIAAMAVFTVLALVVWQGWQVSKPVKLLCNVAGIFAAVVTVQCFAREWQAGILSRLGEASLVIYLLHPYFQGASRAIVSATIGQQGLIQVPIQTAAAIFGPLFVWQMVKRLNWQWLFRLQLSLPKHKPV
jgi:fucose 4-O-acetylase-like acetyltransferase